MECWANGLESSSLNQVSSKQACVPVIRQNVERLYPIQSIKCRLYGPAHSFNNLLSKRASIHSLNRATSTDWFRTYTKHPSLCFHHLLGGGGQIHITSWIHVAQRVFFWDVVIISTGEWIWCLEWVKNFPRIVDSKSDAPDGRSTYCIAHASSNKKYW